LEGWMPGEIVARIYEGRVGWLDAASDQQADRRLAAVVVFDGEMSIDLVSSNQSVIEIRRNSCPLSPILEALRRANGVVLKPTEASAVDALLWYVDSEGRLYGFEARPWTIHRRWGSPRLDELVEITTEGWPIAEGENPKSVFFDRINPTLDDPIIDHRAFERMVDTTPQIICELEPDDFKGEVERIVQHAFNSMAGAHREMQGPARVTIMPPKEPSIPFDKKMVLVDFGFVWPRPAWVTSELCQAMRDEILAKVCELIERSRFHGRQMRMACTGKEPARRSSWRIENLPQPQVLPVPVGRLLEAQLAG
jgi:hypothetical protein